MEFLGGAMESNREAKFKDEGCEVLPSKLAVSMRFIPGSLRPPDENNPPSALSPSPMEDGELNDPLPRELMELLPNPCPAICCSWLLIKRRSKSSR